MIKAPFRFAPINRWVWFPDWGDLVNHDVPFADGYCGEIEIEIEVVTPLLVGGPRRKAASDQQQGGKGGEVWPFRLANGTYAIPGSSLQGLIRSIMEVASFAKLGPFVVDQRFGVRDLNTGATADRLFKRRMVRGNGREGNPVIPQSKAGWLLATTEGPKLLRCKVARIAISDIPGFVPAQRQNALLGNLSHAGKADKRYGDYRGAGGNAQIAVTIDEAEEHRHGGGNILIKYSRCRPAAAGAPANATLVLTGKTQDGIDRPRLKKWEFAFHSPHREDAIAQTAQSMPIPEDVWRDFIDIHDPPKGSGRKENPNWAHWRKEFEGGRPVPVFFLAEGQNGSDGPTAMGTAFMFKLAMDLSTHAMLKNSHEDHLDPHRADLPTIIFGGLEGAISSSLKRRATFDTARLAQWPTDQQDQLVETRSTLLSPKPNYYPIYVRQPRQAPGRPLDLYAAYTRMADGSDPEHRAPELAGVKIWPFAKEKKVPQRGPGGPTSIESDLNALPAGTRFKTKLRLHNMRPVEIGALMWALTFGKAERADGDSRIHRLGMGKALGLGAVRIKIADDACQLLRANSAGQPARSAQEFIDSYTDAMSAHYSSAAPGKSWSQSPQIRALQQASDTSFRDPVQLEYMDGFAEYADERRAGNALGAYSSPDQEIARPNVPKAEVSTDHGGRKGRDGRGFPGPAGGREGPRPDQAFRAEVGCPVRHRDGRTGEIAKIEYGVIHVRVVDGDVEVWPSNSFTVTDPPE